LAKPLTWWAVGEGLKTLGWTPIFESRTRNRVSKEIRLKSVEPVIEWMRTLSREEYLEALDKAYYAHDKVKKEKADKGIDLHGILENYIKTKEILNDRILPFVEWEKRDVKRWIFSEAHCYSTRLWVGGIADACAELNDGKIAIIDFKSSKEAYLSQFFQACGYAIQIEENGFFDENGLLLGKIEKPVDLVIVFPFGADEIKPCTYWDMEGGKKAFECMAYLHKITNV
jgi:hypothetical protein